MEEMQHSSKQAEGSLRLTQQSGMVLAVLMRRAPHSLSAIQSCKSKQSCLLTFHLIRFVPSNSLNLILTIFPHPSPGHLRNPNLCRLIQSDPGSSS